MVSNASQKDLGLLTKGIITRTSELNAPGELGYILSLQIKEIYNVDINWALRSRANDSFIDITVR